MGVSQGEKTSWWFTPLKYGPPVWPCPLPHPPTKWLFISLLNWLFWRRRHHKHWWRGVPLQPKILYIFLPPPPSQNGPMNVYWVLGVIVHMMLTECWHKQLELINIHSSSHCIFKYLLCLFKRKINEVCSKLVLLHCK